MHLAKIVYQWFFFFAFEATIVVWYVYMSGILRDRRERRKAF